MFEKIKIWNVLIIFLEIIFHQIIQVIQYWILNNSYHMTLIAAIDV
jgi:hypothetical protein